MTKNLYEVVATLRGYVVYRGFQAAASGEAAKAAVVAYYLGAQNYDRIRATIA